LIEFGLTPREFREAYFEQQPRLQRGAVGGSPFEWSDLDDVLHDIEPSPSVFQVWNGGLLPADLYSDRVVELGLPRRRLNKRRFYEQLRNGSTLVVNRFESHSRSAMRLCTEVGRFAGCTATGNAYLSLGGRGTFGKHWDTHDVFAIQLFGRKRWRIYSPTFPSPLSLHGSEGSGHECPATPVLDCVLETGDLLYVPRGWWHHAIPFDQPSLHFSIGTYGPTIHDYVMWVCARHLPSFETARRALADPLDRGALDPVLRALATFVLDPARRAEFERELAGRERAGSDFDTELFCALGPDGLTQGTTIGLAARANGNDEPEVVVNGARLRLAAISRGIVAALASSGALSIGELYEQLPQERPETVRAAVLDLAQHDIVTIERHRDDRAAHAGRVRPVHQRLK
jgi:ribosomal protein L16 Arg81 hydroxylase